MIENEIHTRINEALTGRRSQRSFVDQLTGGWVAMTAGLGELADLLERADQSVVRNATGPDAAEFRTVVGTLLHGVDQQGAPRLEGIRERAEAAHRQIDMAAARVRRETVNIGVIGATKAGKSTLLRTITNLPDTVVPSTRFNPTTAAASRIYHTDGPPTAVLELHTWESFRDLYLAPLHALAGLGPVPSGVEGFRGFRYPAAGSDAADGAENDDYLRKLDSAQRSLASYEKLLLGRSRTIAVDFADLRPYVAHPRKESHDPLDVQPYHAVRSVRIEQSFLDGAATRLGLVDLPGSGEAGLDIDRQFLQQVKNEIDLLLMVKRAAPTTASYLATDSYTRTLADSARGGVALDDYYMVAVNHDKGADPEGAYFDNTVASVTEMADERHIRVLTADVADRDEVLAGVLHPLLQHLATRLAEMDREVIRSALSVAAAVAKEVAEFAGEVLRRSHELDRLLPDQEDEFRTLAERLRNALAVDLSALVDRYDANLESGDADTELTAAIGEAVAEARAWVRNGLGHGDRDTWMTEILGQYVYGSLEAKQDEYYRAKNEVTKIFGRVDPSLDHAVQRLWDEIADVLRGRLTDRLVPAGPQALTDLQATAEARRAHILAGALRPLCELKEDYGSVVLRVTQPIIRSIHWDRVPVPAAAPAPPPPMSAAPAPPPPKPAAPAPPPPQRAPAARPGRWVTMPDGSRVRVSPSTVPAVPIGEHRTAKLGAEGLYDELTGVVEHCLDELESALHVEARLMTRTLAAAADRFFDSAIRTNRNERDYEYLCRPDLRSIWPHEFDDGNARLAADLSALQERARATVELTTLVTGLSTGLRTVAGAGPR